MKQVRFMLIMLGLVHFNVVLNNSIVMKKIVTFLLVFAFLAANAQIEVSKLYVENKVNPMGITTDQPRFSWVMISNKRDTKQISYEVRVSENKNESGLDGVFWSSGKIDSGSSIMNLYSGPSLESGKDYFWQVRVWDNHGRKSKWSHVGHWQMGLLNPAKEFKAKWIAPSFEKDTINRPSPYFRKEFGLTSEANVKKATIYITSHGLYEAHINGERIGEDYLTPGWTSYDQRLQYQVYDVTEMLGKTNAIGVVLGNGWYRDYLAWGERRNHYGDDIALLMQLHIQFEDGSEQTLISDGSWKWKTGPILNSEIYDGELYDSTLEMEDWTQPTYEDNDWKLVKVAQFKKDNLIGTENEPIRKQEEFVPKEILSSPSGETIIDFGQNLVGWVQLNISGRKGQKVEIHHAEVLDGDGDLYLDNLRSAEQKTTYILNGEPNQILEPHFTFQGFRYIKVIGLPQEPTAEHIKAIALYSDMEETGKFTTSNPMLNQLQQNIKWGQKGNFIDVPTDCPQRDERLGWTGDAQAFFRTASYNMNVNNFFAKWMKDVAVDQFENGSVPFVVPNVLGPTAGGSAGWADVATIIPWYAYELYGDKKLLEDQYTSMKAWVDYIRDQSEDYLWQTGFHFGDWLFYSPDDDRDGKAAITDKYLIAQCFYAHSTQLLANAARVLGKKEDEAFYGQLVKDIKTAFQKEYVTPSGRLVSSTQTAYVLALQFDMLPQNLRAEAADRLVENIKDYGYHLTTGFLGTPYLNHVLSRFGHADVAYKLLLQDTYPSWLYPVTKGATTIWERWDGIKPDDTFQTPSMNSYNHYAYGAIGEWMYQNIGGIQPNMEGPGYKKFDIKIIPGGEITHADASLKTYYGEIASSWTLENSTFTQVIKVPVNTTAHVTLPFGTMESLKEGKKALEKAEGVTILPSQGESVELDLASGEYHFTTQVEMENLKESGFEGTYKTTSGFFDELTVNKNQDTYYLTIAETTIELVPGKEDSNLYLDKEDAQNSVKLQRNAQGNVVSVQVVYHGQRLEAVRQ